MHIISDVRKYLIDKGCIYEGKFFFALENGNIANTYVSIKPLLIYPSALQALMNMLLRDKDDFSVISGTTIGTIPLVYAGAEVTNHRFGYNLRTVFPQKTESGFEFSHLDFKRALRGQRVLIVTGVATTGITCRKVSDLVTQAGGTIASYCLLWNRDPDAIHKDTMGAPVHSLISERLDSWEPETHPHWGEWPLVTDIGHPELFSDYPGPTIALRG